MHRLIGFIKQIYVVLLFVLLECGALWHYASSSPYTEATMLARTTKIGGAISQTITNIGHFFSMPDENRMLTARIAELEQQLSAIEELYGERTQDTTLLAGIVDTTLHYRYHAARVSSITTSRQRNYIVLDKGSEDGIAPNMGVITPSRQLVGYIVSCSERYAVVLPILNTEFHIGGRLVHNNELCKVQWDGSSTHEAQVIDLSSYADPERGMAVNVSSPRLPDDVLIGYIESFESNAQKSAYSARISLATRFSVLDNVLIVENTHYDEIERLTDEATAKSNE